MFNPKSALISLLAFQLLNILVATSAHSQAEPFYKGKQIRIVTGATAGGFYDRWARLLARAMPKYLPGQPDIIVQNMPGGGSLVAANYVYGVAKPDGLTMVMPNSNVYLEQLSGHKEVRFDLRKFPIIGSQEKNYMLLYMRADAPYKTIGDIIKAKEPPKCGSTGVGSAGYILDRVLEVALGAKINTVMGYPGGNEIDLAVEKGEVHCRGNTILPHFGREPFDTWHKKGFDRHLIQTARKRDPVVAEAPTIYELMDQSKTTESNRASCQCFAQRRRVWPLHVGYAWNAFGQSEDAPGSLRKVDERPRAHRGSQEGTDGHGSLDRRRIAGAGPRDYGPAAGCH